MRKRRGASAYINRELSWLEFNSRVLEEALDETVPLLERLKFLAITSSNLDEFFMVRVAGIKRQIEAEVVEPAPDEMPPAAQDEAISAAVHAMAKRQYAAWAGNIAEGLAKAGIVFSRPWELDAKQRRFLARLFETEIYPVLTPIAVDSRHPFPMLLNLNLYLAVSLAGSQDRKMKAGALAFVQAPSVIPRVLEVPGASGARTFVFLEDVIRDNLATVFEGRKVAAAYALRVTRDADLTIDEEGAEDLLKSIEYELKRRPRGSAVRLEVEKDAPENLVARAAEELGISRRDVYSVDGPIDLKPLMKLAFDIDRPDLKEPICPPVPVSFGEDRGAVWKRIARGEILVHHPYESFDIVTDFIDAAADDPDVLAIKQTLYRITENSPVVKALARAADNGKEVTALVELKARFDEQKNIGWAKTLEEAGANVVYGLMGLKIHCKASLVVRREPGGIRRYLHLSTGNYNEVTARIYSDIGLFTADEAFGADASALFNVITGYSEPARLKKLEMAPFAMRDRIVWLISRERDRARAGAAARIVAKMNSLVDRTVVDALYEASQAGVRIDLIVRGICCLRPGVKGLSSNIRVISIVDRFLEHSRIFHFHNGGQNEYYLSSADWMPRNLDRRIELMFPVEDRALKARLREILDVQLSDAVKARELMPDGTYRRVKGGKRVRSQEELYRRARAAFEKGGKKGSARGRKLVPRRAPGKT